MGERRHLVFGTCSAADIAGYCIKRQSILKFVRNWVNWVVRVGTEKEEGDMNWLYC